MSPAIVISNRGEVVAEVLGKECHPILISTGDAYFPADIMVRSTPNGCKLESKITLPEKELGIGAMVRSVTLQNGMTVEAVSEGIAQYHRDGRHNLHPLR